MSILKEVFPFLIPVFVIQLGLQVYSILNLVKRRKVRFNNKLLWGIVIVLFGILGPVAYMIFRGDEG
jgi:hypothetical protein